MNFKQHFFKMEWLGRLLLLSCMGLLLGVLQGCAHTEEKQQISTNVTALLERYPAGNINSMEKADQALEAVKYEKLLLDERFKISMDACVKRFLVNNCYDETELRLIQDKAALKPLIIEAERFKRKEKVRLRDEALVDAQRKEVEKAPKREESRKQYEEKTQQYKQQAIAEGEKGKDYLKAKVADEAAPPALKDGAYTVTSPSEPKDPDILTPEKRAANIEAYEAKKEEAKRKQENVERKMAETQDKRDTRAAKEAAPKEGPRKRVAQD